MSPCAGAAVGRSVRLSRRGRRRLLVVAGVAALGVGARVWMPRLLAALPAFRVERVEVVGTRYVAPDSVVRLAAVEPDASVWDDPARWEARVESHPLVLAARVRRDGMRALEIRVEEKTPVALVATPALLPVNAEGQVLPLEPWVVGLDLPVIVGETRVADGRIADPRRLALAALIGRLAATDPGFLAQVSEVGYAEGGGYEFVMMAGSDAGRVLLPGDHSVRALHRISLALGQLGERRVARADARFEDRVVIATEGPEDGS